MRVFTNKNNIDIHPIEDINIPIITAPINTHNISHN